MRREPEGGRLFFRRQFTAVSIFVPLSITSDASTCCVTRESFVRSFIRWSLTPAAYPHLYLASSVFLIRIQLFSQYPPRRGFSICEINCYKDCAACRVPREKKNRLGELAPILYFDYTARSSHCSRFWIFLELAVRFFSLAHCETLALSFRDDRD